MTTKPWIEKYRPGRFDEIVLEPINRQLFQQMIETDRFPHLLFYGPPGTGKTTTIINLIQEYQKKHNIKHSGNIIHLNASDERGIDTIRNQIQQFVMTKNLFDAGLKFVILDEVDYMTKNAQQALKELLLTCQNVRFCLICNYISKIDPSLQHEFVCIRFNQLPRGEIFAFVNKIAAQENIALTETTIEKMYHMYGSDIRSMINFLQSGAAQETNHECASPLHAGVFEQLYASQTTAPAAEQRELATALCREYNCDVRHMFRYYFNYILRHHKYTRNEELSNWLSSIEESIHHQDKIPPNVLLSYYCPDRGPAP